MLIQESAEMYLETILELTEEGARVRAVDVAKKMGHSRPTVSEWMKKLSANDLVYIEDDGGIHLTPTGAKIATNVFKRHVALTAIFESIGVSPETARQDACRVEHYISEETFNCLKAHFETK